MMMISLKLVIYQKGFILEKVTKKKVMSDWIDVLFVVYIITIHLEKSYFFQEFFNMSKINHMKKVIGYINVFKKYFSVRQEVSDEIQTGIFLLKMSFELP